MGAAVEVDRTRVLAYRVAAHQLDRERRPLSELAVADLGVPDVPAGSARLALSARTSVPVDDEAIAGAGLVMVWAARGAPHLHRLADLPRLAEALWPFSDVDAWTRIASGHIKDAAPLGVAAFTAGARAMRRAVPAPTPRGEVSTAVSADVPPELTFWCTPCKAQHVSGGLFQQVGLAAGVRLVPGTTPAVLAPVEDWPGVPERMSGVDSLVRAYLRLLGPAGPSEVARYLGTKPTELRTVWPDDLVEVRVDGRRAWLPADRVDALRSAPPPGVVRLLPPSDPWLQARDRDLIVPERAHQKEVWRILGNPGVVLVDGEVRATWRGRMAGRRLDITVAPFGPLPARVKSAVEAEARRVADARAVKDFRVRVD